MMMLDNLQHIAQLLPSVLCQGSFRNTLKQMANSQLSHNSWRRYSYMQTSINFMQGIECSWKGSIQLFVAILIACSNLGLNAR